MAKRKALQISFEESESKENKEKIQPKKDNWDKVQIASLAFAAFAVPLLVALIGQLFSSIERDKQASLKIVELSIDILKQEKSRIDQDDPVRLWAAKVIDKYSGELLGEDGQVILANRRFRIDDFFPNILACKNIPVTFVFPVFRDDIGSDFEFKIEENSEECNLTYEGEGEMQKTCGNFNANVKLYYSDARYIDNNNYCIVTVWPD